MWIVDHARLLVIFNKWKRKQKSRSVEHGTKTFVSESFFFFARAERERERDPRLQTRDGNIRRLGG
jgi:hypothetical protein